MKVTTLRSRPAALAAVGPGAVGQAVEEAVQEKIVSEGIAGPEAEPNALMRIAVIGAGHIGLVTAACFASLGHRVVAIDTDQERIAAIRGGQIPFHEAELPQLVAEQAAQGRLKFACEFEGVVNDAELIFIAVGTPEGADGEITLDALDRVAQQLVAHAAATSVVVLKSTVPVGTARSMQSRLRSRVLSNPEFLREGTAIQDFLNPDRIVIGCDVEDADLDVSGEDDSNANEPSDAALDRLRLAYAPLIAQGVPLLIMDTRSAELTKCAANAMLATRISFVNEIAAIADATGADIESVCDGIGSDHRIGRAFLGAGLGYGGSCFPKDVAMLRHIARQHHLRADLLTATERVNSRQHCWPAHAMARWAGSWSALRGMRAAVWGLAFKPGTDDMRNAPSVALIERLRRVGLRLAVYDPAAMDNARELLGSDRHLRWCDSAAQALEDADTLLLLTEWPEFVSFAAKDAALALRVGAVVFDARNVLDVSAWRQAGIRVVQVGRPSAELASQLDDSVLRWDDEHSGHDVRTANAR